MKELIPTIDEIAKYGLQPNLIEVDKEISLAKNLVKIYNLYFNLDYEFDETDYPDFENEKYPNIRQNVESNFKDFGVYKMVLEINDLVNDEIGIGDAVDDLSDIIKDLLEVKWRIENNSINDGLWFFNFIFNAHTEEHIINLLNFIKQRE
ncbi:hypothetical protein SAMN05444377_11725 [Flavobacterium fontis]|uniref:DUF5063 domain-containing protein n=1 Tax=Flavobacterium fontis TaxID=1124188 RepID=A0A1M5E1H7_9FLAO|nr:hypothetical protein [Flavobacterium fontis]SHF72974.1 hypothetical protein SAMN05444377_11725 [Flavobacterium fontis]